MGKAIYTILMVLVTGSWIASCNTSFISKPKGYFDIQLPEHQYNTFNEPGYPYSFDYPVYSKISKDSMFFDNQAENPWWINIEFPGLNGKIFISYKSLQTNNFDTLINDAYNLSYKHSIKAYSINDSIFNTTNNISGVYFNVGGDAASASQFYLTDSNKNFIRGALYFEATPNEDSLAPVNKHVKEDLLHLINSFKWQ